MAKSKNIPEKIIHKTIVLSSRYVAGTKEDVDSFDKEITEHLNDGWKLNGSVSVSIAIASQGGTCVYTQSLTKSVSPSTQLLNE